MFLFCHPRYNSSNILHTNFHMRKKPYRTGDKKRRSGFTLSRFKYYVDNLNIPLTSGMVDGSSIYDCYNHVDGVLSQCGYTLLNTFYFEGTSTYLRVYVQEREKYSAKFKSKSGKHVSDILNANKHYSAMPNRHEYRDAFDIVEENCVFVKFVKVNLKNPTVLKYVKCGDGSHKYKIKKFDKKGNELWCPIGNTNSKKRIKAPY